MNETDLLIEKWIGRYENGVYKNNTKPVCISDIFFCGAVIKQSDIVLSTHVTDTSFLRLLLCNGIDFPKCTIPMEWGPIPPGDRCRIARARLAEFAEQKWMEIYPFLSDDQKGELYPQFELHSQLPETTILTETECFI